MPITNKFRQQRGSSLLEVLISLIILAIGILGLSATLTSSLRSNHAAYLRTQATIFGYDIVERMRANTAGVSAGSYNDPTPVIYGDCIATTGCSSAQLASNDVAEWEASIAAGLPSGTGTICLDANPADATVLVPACDVAGGSSNVYAATIWWDSNRDGTANQKFVMSFQP